MRGTLAEGDGVRIAAVAYAALRPGDVVAYRSSGQVVVHRIVGRRNGQWLTQGDGNWRRDASPLPPDRYVGAVASRERNGMATAVVGGSAGLRRAAWLHAAAFVRWSLLAALAPAYRLLRASRAVALVWRPRILAVRFAGPGGGGTKFIHRGRAVAHWVPQAGRWTCRKPYDLLIPRPDP